MEHLIEDEFQNIYHKHKKMHYMMQGALNKEQITCIQLETHKQKLHNHGNEAYKGN